MRPENVPSPIQLGWGLIECAQQGTMDEFNPCDARQANVEKAIGLSLSGVIRDCDNMIARWTASDPYSIRAHFITRLCEVVVIEIVH